MRVPWFGRAGALAAVVVLVVAACGGGGGSASSPGQGSGSSAGAAAAGNGGSAGSLDACTLLSTAEIQSAVGWAVADGVLQDTDTQTDCEWNGQTDQAGGVGLIIQDFDASLWQAGSSSSYSTAVSGIGDAAFKGWPHAGDLSIKYKSYEVDVAIIDFSKPDATVDQETLALAKLVLSRI